MSHLPEILAPQTTGSSLPLPAPRVAISVRAATMEDLPFLDALQKQYSKALGYFPTKQFEGYIAMGGVLIAQTGSAAVGYVISRDRYLKRDELGVIYQLCVAPGAQRKLVGAALVREVFARSAYGCKLYCCWCAQDLPANRFWQSMGFLPIAFRAGSRGKQRVHIFWERRIREGDVTTPYWFPAQTNAGAMAEDRLVLPIPPGTEWHDVMPRILPKERPTLVDETKSAAKETKGTQGTRAPQAPKTRGVRLGAPPSGRMADAVTVQVGIGAGEKPKRPKRPKAKNDPQHVAAARELRDRWMEEVSSGRFLPGGADGAGGAGKYDPGRALPSPVIAASPLALPDAA